MAILIHTTSPWKVGSVADQAAFRWSRAQSSETLDMETKIYLDYLAYYKVIDNLYSDIVSNEKDHVFCGSFPSLRGRTALILGSGQGGRRSPASEEGARYQLLR